jgi:hypothetical protein
MKANEITKAIVGAAAAGTAALVTATLDNNVSLTEWAVIINSVVATFAIVWGAPNAPMALKIAQDQPHLDDKPPTVKVVGV